MSLFPWHTNCGCLIVDDGEIRLVQRCERHTGAPLRVVHANIPPAPATEGDGA